MSRGFGVRKRVSEKQVEHAIDERLGAVGFTVTRFSQARPTQQTPGIPDRRYVHRDIGLAFWFEVKAEDGIWSRTQQDFAADCRAAGELYLVGGMDELYEALQALGLWNGHAFRPQGWRTVTDHRTRLEGVCAASRARWARG